MNRKLSKNTQRALNLALRDFHAVTGQDVNNITQASIEEWDRSMVARGLSVSTRRQRLSLLSQKNPYLDLHLPEREEPAQFYLQKDQIAKLFSAIPKNLQGHLDFFLFALFLLTGWRNSEVRKLRWEQFSQNEKFIVVEKENK